MRTQSLKQFFLEEAVNYASYSTIRMIGSAIDGQKNNLMIISMNIDYKQ